MYPSDYGYATSGSSDICNNVIMVNWISSLDASVYTECVQNSWLYESDWQWIITPHSVDSFYAFYVYGSYVYHDYVNGSFVVYPVLYLNSDVKIVGGQGTSDQPYEFSQ